MLDYEVIASGSSGNAVRIENIMIDCGVPFIKMKEALYKCKYLFITHIHSDHIRRATLKSIRQYFPNIQVFGNYEVAYQFKIDKAISEDYPFKVGELTVIPFDCPHGNTKCTGYSFIINRHRIIYATDTSSLRNAPAGPYDYLFIEANYCERKLAAIKNPAKQYGYNVVGHSERHLSKQAAKTFYYLNRRDRESVLIELHKSQRFY